MAYRTCTDEVLVTNSMIDISMQLDYKGKEALESGFKFIKISELDEIV